MRSILVTVDDTPSAIAARGLAVALAHQCGAMIRGVTAIEVSDLDRVQAIPIGGMQYAYDRLQHREKLATERRARIADLPALFRRSLADEGMEACCATMEADVRGGLLRMIETCDLVVTGRDAEFHLDPLEGVTPLVEHIIAKGCRPVVVSGPKQLGSGPVLVAYDGSAPAAKALQMAVLLGIFRPSGAHILSISRDRAAANRAVRARGISSFTTALYSSRYAVPSLPVRPFPSLFSRSLTGRLFTRPMLATASGISAALASVSSSICPREIRRRGCLGCGATIEVHK
jgi:nucleotide-binding universal stress UspA family protein